MRAVQQQGLQRDQRLILAAAQSRAGGGGDGVDMDVNTEVT